MPKCDFNKAAKQLYCNHTSSWVFSCKFAIYFQNTVLLEHPWRAASDHKDHTMIMNFVLVSFLLRLKKYHVNFKC